jgi:serine/threonine protein kinase
VLGATVGNFVIVARLGKGGMGEVWLAEHATIKTRVAIKLLTAEVSTDTHQVQRFFNEAVAVGKIRHAGIGKIFDVGFHESGQAYLVMEYLEGESLAKRIRRAGRLSIGQVADLGRQIASVLDATHAAGITHRDLKPDNIFLVKDSELATGVRVKLLDFGIAKLSNLGMTATSVGVMGTPLYMSPEQWRNVSKVDPRADVYSLGCVAFEMACGRPPFLAESMGEACAKHMTDLPPPARSIVPELPEMFDLLVARLLEKDPALRPTMKDVTHAFTTLARDHEVAHDETVPQPIRPSGSLGETQTTQSPMERSPYTTLSAASGALPGAKRRKSRVPLFAAIGAVAVVGTVATLILMQTESEPTSTPTPAPVVESVLHDAAIVPPDAAAAEEPRWVALKRIAGELPEIKAALDVRLCIDTTGNVIDVQLNDDIDASIKAIVTSRVASWQYAPYLVGNVAKPACTVENIPRHTVVAATKTGPQRAPLREPQDSVAKQLEIAAMMGPVEKLRPKILACGDTATIGMRFAVQIQIAPDGHVLRADVPNSPNQAVAACIEATIKTARFPQTRLGGKASLPLFFGTSVSPPAGTQVGYMSIVSEPSCEILVDGKPSGKTPQHRIPVLAGSRTITLVSAQAGVRDSFSLDIKPNVTYQVHKDYTKTEPTKTRN